MGTGGDLPTDGMGPGRLATILSWAIPARVVADIGAGDGQLAMMAAAAGARVIATEAKEGPYQRLRQRLVGSPGIEVRFGDGFSPLAAGEADVIVIAGMGAKTICGILERGEAVAKAAQRLVLQPMRSADPIRRMLVDGRWSWSNEDLAYDGEHFYEVLVIDTGRERLAWDPGRQPLGPGLSTRDDPLGRAYRTAHLRRLEHLVATRLEAGRSVLHLEETIMSIRNAAPSPTHARKAGT